jgi:hypothetical protein
MTQRDPLKLSLASELAQYKPGETVTAVLLASTPLPPEDVELHDLEIKFTGIERVDTAWIVTQYRKDVPAINSDRRRVQRRVVHAQLHAATQGNFVESRTRRFLIK